MNSPVDMSSMGMSVLFASYATVFFFMAGITWRSMEKTAKVGIVAPLVMLVVFAVVHGFSDVIDAIMRFPGVDSSPTGALAAVRITLLAASFVFLLIYGLASLIDDMAIFRVIVILGLVGMVGMVAGIAALFAEGAAAGSVASAERATRLFLALPSGMLAAAALFRSGRRCGALGMEHCERGARLAAVSMAAYAVFAGAFATGYPQAYRLLGLPIQAHRMLAAVALTVGLAWMLERMSLSGEGD